MRKRNLMPRLALFSAVVFSTTAYGGALPIGFVSFDPGTGNTGVFDIVNMTGPNDSTYPDTSFPVATSVVFSNLLLTVDFLGGGSTTLNASNFASDGNGGFIGLSQFDLTAFPISCCSTTESPPSAVMEASSRQSCPVPGPAFRWATSASSTQFPNRRPGCCSAQAFSGHCFFDGVTARPRRALCLWWDAWPRLSLPPGRR